MMQQDEFNLTKPCVSLCFIGGQQCGKSTLVSSLGATLKTPKRRYNGNTQTDYVVYEDFHTNLYNCMLVDTPGNDVYIKNVLSGLLCADVSVLVVDSITGN